MKIRFLLAALCMSFSLFSNAIDNGTYYLYNIGAQRWMSFGGTDGYTSCFYHYGSPLTLTASGDGYTITGTHYDTTNGLSATGAGRTTSAVFTITETAQGSGIYTIASTNGYLGYDASKESTLQSGTTVATNLRDDGNDNVHWQLITRQQLEDRLQDASAEKPVDATFYITCPGFNRHEVGIKTDWTVTNINVAGFYYNPNQCLWNTNSSSADELCDMNQKLTGLKAGKYTLTCQGFYRAGSNTVAYNSYSAGTYPNNAVLYAGDETCPLLPIYTDGQTSSAIYDAGKATNSEWTWTNYTQKGGLYYPYYSDGNTYPSTSAAVAFDNNLYQAREGYNTVTFTVGSSGTITIGARTTAALAYDWIAVDNLHLEYLGEVSQDEKSKELEAAREEALKTIQTLYGDVETRVQAGEALTTFLTALQTAKTNIANAVDKEAVTAIVEQLAADYLVLLRQAQPAEGQSLDYTVFLQNPSFETGDLTGWVYTAISGDHAVYSNASSNYTTTGCDGTYLFNTWYQSDSYVAEAEDYFVQQTVRDLPTGEYLLEALEASNTYYYNVNTPVTLFANHFTQSSIPQHKGEFTNNQLQHIYLTPDMRSLTIGVRSASWFKADNFRLYYLGQTSDYTSYVNAAYAEASLAQPVLFDNHDGQQSTPFIYTEIGGHTHGGYPISVSKMSDGTRVDRSLMQDWTGTGYQLGKSTIATSYSELPSGYYKISAYVRVYDENGDYDGTATGLSIYANDKSTPITTGTQITSGSLSGKGFWGLYSVITKVEDGQLDTGFRLDGTSMNWVGFQDFRLEYIGKTDPMTELVNLNLPAGQFVPLCMPYQLKPAYFGQTYLVAQVKDGNALLMPVETVASGTPCVVMATGENPTITLDDVTLDYSTPGKQMVLWGNVYLTGDFTSRQWTATLDDKDNTQVEAQSLTFTALDPENLDVTMTIENRQAEKFLDECNYKVGQSTSVISNYNVAPPARRDQPNIFRLPMSDGTEYLIANMIPDSTYLFDLTDGNGKHYAGSVKAEGTLRMIYLPSGSNIRDLGGWTTLDKRQVRYGLLYRGGALNGNLSVTDTDLQTLKDMGIGAEIDLRWKDGYSQDSQTGISALGYSQAEGTYYFAAANDYLASDISTTASQQRWAEEFRFILKHLREGHSVYYHCAIGADRTGLLTMMLEGILGLSEPDIYRDYELTTFSSAGTRLLTSWSDRLAVIKTYSGLTLTKRFENFFKNKMGITADEIEEFRVFMLYDPSATGIEEHVNTTSAPASVAVYSLSGQRLAQPQRGINIIGGKKLLVK